MFKEYEYTQEELKKMSKREKEERLALLEAQDYNLYQNACFIDRFNERIHKEEAWY